jgi:AraC family transcriptional regulator
LAKIAVNAIAARPGWSVEEVVCSHGPADRPFEELHGEIVIAIVMAGSFQYRGSGVAWDPEEMMTPGSLLLGSPGQCFECGHEHSTGDRCLAFRFTPDYFESITSDARGRGARRTFGRGRVPPLRELSPFIAQASAAFHGSADVEWEELGVRLAARAVQVDDGRRPSAAPISAAALARVTETIRAIEHGPHEALSLAQLAQRAGVSRFHFLRIFERLTGVTPHQYLISARLRQAAIRLHLDSSKIVDVALDCGFNDVSNFNRTFRAEFGVSPRAYRQGVRSSS